MDRKKYYMCKECGKNTEVLENEEYFCKTCNQTKQRSEVEMCRAVKPAKTPTPIMPQDIFKMNDIGTDIFDMPKYGGLNSTINTGGIKNE